MAQRKFELPAIEKLSKEQEEVRALPMPGQHLVIGGPGTGKSVIALLRARRHSENQDDYLFLVYNRLLHQASCQLFPENRNNGVTNAFTDLRIETWDSWFRNKVEELCARPCPLLPPKSPGGYKGIDWTGVEALIEGAPPPDLPLGYPFLIIDEGQDMPPQFYGALLDLGFENIFVVADQNQQINPDRNSSIQQIEDALGIDHKAVIRLGENYRNSFPVARLARHFYPEDPAAPPPALPPPSKSAKTPRLVEYGTTDGPEFGRIVRRILITADRDPKRLIGIFAASNEIRTKYINALTATRVQLEHPHPKIQTYSAAENNYRIGPALAFNEGGIMVINANSCKGLEFDIVFIADINGFPCYQRILVEKRRLFYVMTARAKETVILIKNAESNCEVDSILPNDPELLNRGN